MNSLCLDWLIDLVGCGPIGGCKLCFNARKQWSYVKFKADGAFLCGPLIENNFRIVDNQTKQSLRRACFWFFIGQSQLAQISILFLSSFCSNFQVRETKVSIRLHRHKHNARSQNKIVLDTYHRKCWQHTLPSTYIENLTSHLHAIIWPLQANSMFSFELSVH